MIDINLAKKIAERYKRIYGRSIRGRINGISPPNVFVSKPFGSKVKLGVLVSNDEVIDDPIIWSLHEKDPREILMDRLKLINAYLVVDQNIWKKNIKFFDEIVDGNLSISHVTYDINVGNPRTIRNFRKLPMYLLSVNLKYLRLDSAPKIPRVVLNIVEDFDLKAEDAVKILYDKGFSDYYLQRVLSLGAFGFVLNRKLLPSRQAITAVHSILCKKLTKEVNEFRRSLNYIMMFFGGHYGNYFYVILFPFERFFYEYFEVFLPGSVYNKFGKPIWGRDEDSGGYFASKLSVLEILKMLRIKVAVLVIRIVTPEYKFPLGVWVVREGVKKVVKSKNRFYDLYEFIKYISDDSYKRFRFNVLNIIRKSKIIAIYRNKKIKDYVNSKRASPK